MASVETTTLRLNEEVSVQVNIVSPNTSVKQIIAARAETSFGREDIEDPFYVVDIGRIYELFDVWKAAFPNVQPFYAVKVNPDPVLVNVLAKLGVGFDCASKCEIETVLKLGATASQIIYANPNKQVSHLKYARSSGVDLMTFDHAVELHKIKEHHPSAKLVLRLALSLSKDPRNIDSKMGCSVSSALGLLDTAKQLKLTIVGVCFQVGAGDEDTHGCRTAERYSQALRDADKVFEYAAKIGYEFTLIDIGGGFPGHWRLQECFAQVAADIMTCFASFRHPKAKIIAEPGHYFACSPFTAASCVVSKKSSEVDGSDLYITTDGLFGSFNELVYFPNHSQSLEPKFLKGDNSSEGTSIASVWGATCAPDRVMGDTEMTKLEVGDWMYFEDMGGYSISLFAGFNGFPRPAMYYYIRESHRQRLITD